MATTSDGVQATPPKVPAPFTSALLGRLLSPFAEVHADEALSVVLLTLNVFVLLTGYYFLKTLREPWVLASPHGAEIKSYAAAGQSLLCIGVVRAYGALVKRYGRLQLSVAVTLFFAANLGVFVLLDRLDVPFLGVAFYLWVGCYSLTSISQFWSFANDCFTPDEGKRLFSIIAVGGSIGSMVGAFVAGRAFAPLGRGGLMLAAIGLLAVCLALTFGIERQERRRVAHAPRAVTVDADAPVANAGAAGGFTLIRRDKYLMLIAAVVLLINWENSTGEYICDRELTAWAARTAGETGQTVGNVIGAFKGDYFFWANTLGVLAQLFLVSRVLKYGGPRLALFMGPFIGGVGYALAAMFPILGVIRVAKITENANDYSVQNTTNKVLFLPVDREAKYTANVAIGTVLVRFGDVLAAVVVFVGSSLDLPTRAFAVWNLLLVAVWVALAVALGRENKARVAAAEAQIA